MLSLAIEAVEVALGDLREPQAGGVNSPWARVAADEVTALEADQAVVVPLLSLVSSRLAELFHQCQRSVAQHVHAQRDRRDCLTPLQQLQPPRPVLLRIPHATPAALLRLDVCKQRKAFCHLLIVTSSPPRSTAYLVRLKVFFSPILPHDVPERRRLALRVLVLGLVLGQPADDLRLDVLGDTEGTFDGPVQEAIDPVVAFSLPLVEVQRELVEGVVALRVGELAQEALQVQQAAHKLGKESYRAGEDLEGTDLLGCAEILNAGGDGAQLPLDVVVASPRKENLLVEGEKLGAKFV
eukprot:752524-Hanusia_phi.AAC.2